VGLRHLLGDHVDYNATTNTYTENPANLHHSPILGWMRDGLPIYGPYAYSSPLNASSGIRRMTSGFVLRNGSNGTDNLATTGRTTIPAWAQRASGLAAAQTGAPVNATYPIGRYLEDNAYRGDLGQTLGADFDLNEWNARYCLTPEFPAGTWAYFVTIHADGAPAFPYHCGRSYFGTPSGGAVTGHGIQQMPASMPVSGEPLRTRRPRSPQARGPPCRPGTALRFL
jgi:YHYH protein